MIFAFGIAASCILLGGLLAVSAERQTTSLDVALFSGRFKAFVGGTMVVAGAVIVAATLVVR